MKQFITSSSLTIYQKLMMFLLFIALFTISFRVIEWSFSDIPIDEILEEDWLWLRYTPYFFIPVSVIVFLSLFLKNGLLIKNNNLYVAKFLFDKPVYKYKVSLRNKTDLSILEYENNLKLVHFQFAMSDKSYSEYRYEVYLLDKNHLNKEYLFYTLDKLQAETIIEELSDLFDLQYNIYSPNY